MKQENKPISILKLEIEDEIDSYYTGEFVRLNIDYEAKVIDKKEYDYKKRMLEDKKQVELDNVVKEAYRRIGKKYYDDEWW